MSDYSDNSDRPETGGPTEDTSQGNGYSEPAMEPAAPESPSADPMPADPPALETVEAPSEQQEILAEQSDDPIEEALYTTFMQASATGADATQAFNVALHAAKQVALDLGIPEDAYERIAADMYGPYTAAVTEGHNLQEALRVALQALDT